MEAFEDWTQPYTWAFVKLFPTPQALVQATLRQRQTFLHTHKLWRPGMAEQRLEIFAQADQFCGGEAVTRAKSRLALALCHSLETLQRQLDDYRAAIEKLFAEHPDHDVFGSLPGIGPKLGPRLLSAMGADRKQYPDVQDLQCLAGTAPVRGTEMHVRSPDVQEAVGEFFDWNGRFLVLMILGSWLGLGPGHGAWMAGPRETFEFVVLDLQRNTTFTVQRDGNDVSIAFDDAPQKTVAAAPRTAEEAPAATATAPAARPISSRRSRAPSPATSSSIRSAAAWWCRTRPSDPL